MPKLLASRLAADSIAEFRAASRLRNVEAQCLAREGHPAAAVYLWGYVAEMTLKAAWFALLGFPDHQPVQSADLRAAVAMAERLYGIQWPSQGRLHSVLHWAELLISHRASTNRPYPHPGFDAKVVAHAKVIYDRWRETLRYKKNRPYPAELGAVDTSVQWLLANSNRL